MPILEELQHQHQPHEANPQVPNQIPNPQPNPPAPHQGLHEILDQRFQLMQEQIQLKLQGMHDQLQRQLNGIQQYTNAVSINSYNRGMNSQAGIEDDLLPLHRELPAQGPPPLPQQNDPLPQGIFFPKRKIRCAALTGNHLDALGNFYGVNFHGGCLERRRISFMTYVGLR